MSWKETLLVNAPRPGLLEVHQGSQSECHGVASQSEPHNEVHDLASEPMKRRELRCSGRSKACLRSKLPLKLLFKP